MPSKLAKYIALIFEVDDDLNVSLETKIEVSGGLYEFIHNYNKNITNVKAGSIFYFPISHVSAKGKCTFISIHLPN